MAKASVMTFARRIPTDVDTVWSVISDPYAMVRTDPRARLVSTHGEPGEIGSGYSVVMFGLTMERVVAEAVIGQRLVLHQVSSRDRTVLGVQTGELQRDGDATLLSWTVTEPPLPLKLNQVSALAARFALPRWLARVEREAISHRDSTGRG